MVINLSAAPYNARVDLFLWLLSMLGVNSGGPQFGLFITTATRSIHKRACQFRQRLKDAQAVGVTDYQPHERVT